MLFPSVGGYMLKMVAIEGEESPYTASKISLISLRDFPSKNKN